MADDIKKTVILKVDLDVATYKKDLATLTQSTAALQKESKKLDKTTLEGAKAFSENSIQIKKNNKEISDLKQVIVNTEKANNAYTKTNDINKLSQVQLKAALSASTYELNKLSTEQQNGTTRGQLLKEQVLGLSDALKSNETAVGNNYRNVGNYSEALKELKAELKAAKSEAVAMASQFGLDSKEFIESTRRAGELSDKLNDVNESTKVFASGSKFEQFGNSLKGIGGDLKNLDFEGAAEKAKQLGNIARTMTFKEMISGAKASAVAFYEMAAAFLATPFGMVTAGIGLLVGSLFAMSKASHDSTAEVIADIDKMDARYKALSDAKIKILKAYGQDTKQAELDALDEEKFQLNNRIRTLENQSKKIVGLNEEEEKQLEDLRAKRLQNVAEIIAKEYEIKKSISDSRKKDIEEELKNQQEATAKQAELDKKALEDLKQRNKEREDANLKYLLEIEEQKIAFIKDDEARETAKLALDNVRKQEEISNSLASEGIKNERMLLQQKAFEEDLTALQAKYIDIRQQQTQADYDKYTQANKTRIDTAISEEQRLEQAVSDSIQKSFDEAMEATAKEREQQKTNKQLLIDGANQLQDELSNIIFQAQQERNKRDLDNQTNYLQTKHDSETALLQAQLTAGAISEAEFNEKKIASDKQLAEAQLKIQKEAFEKDKQLKIRQVAMNLLVELSNIALMASASLKNVATGGIAGLTQYAIMSGIAIARAGIQTAGIASQQFADGGLALSGKKIGSNDGKSIYRPNGDNLLATVKSGEVILNDNQQAMLGGDDTFRAIGVPGFAGGGSTDGGALASRLSSSVDSQINAINQQKILNRTMKPPVVIVQDIIDSVNNNVKVTSRGNI